MRLRILEFKNISIYSLHAIEDLIFELVASDKSDPTIIFSSVKPGISISLKQNYYLDIDERECLNDKIDVTRRKTGGRSIYFDENYLILSIIDKNENYININKIYQKNIDIIIKALNKITNKNFNLENKNDIMVDGKKIGGAAQKSSNNCSLVHCYIRVNNSLDKMLRYVKIDDKKLDNYYDELKQFITSVNDLINIKDFYNKFKTVILENKEYNYEKINHGEYELLIRKINEYKDETYIKGSKNLPSKGNCDIIAGSGKDAKLKIKSLEGKVKFV